MDNASKALIMAGAILIAVMLVSLGVMLFSRAQDTAIGATDNMDALAVNAYNTQFLNYVGENQKGSSILNLLSNVEASNAVSTSSEVSVQYNGAASTPATMSNSIKRSYYYTVKVVSYDSDTGLLDTINVVDQTGGKKV